MKTYRDTPKDIEYKQKIPFYKLIIGALSDGLLRSFELLMIAVVVPIKFLLRFLKSCSIDFVVWIFDMLAVTQEHFLNLQRLKQEDPDGTVNIYSKNYERKYGRDYGALKGWLVGIYSTVSFWFILYANGIQTITALGDKLDIGVIFIVGTIILVMFPFFLLDNVHDRFRQA